MHFAQSELIYFQDEYYCPITSDKPVLKGWQKGAKEFTNMVRCNGIDDMEDEVVFLAKTGKKPIRSFFFLIFNKQNPH